MSDINYEEALSWMRIMAERFPPFVYLNLSTGKYLRFYATPLGETLGWTKSRSRATIFTQCSANYFAFKALHPRMDVKAIQVG